jgi:hypothetical protein
MTIESPVNKESDNEEERVPVFCGSLLVVLRRKTLPKKLQRRSPASTAKSHFHLEERKNDTAYP